ncbi:hypothetical protein QQ008_26140 [Fulvivirgaceae bacterium BMA10]|uniref:Uncharacterized protein n=1 Tax=Splendidivirga corallicola TaxID=3051826 RepID=A0ABT8KXK6_9BACT|nr:hypothetical protein [Fulvivirgaceae bacterium BMA10]
MKKYLRGTDILVDNWLFMVVAGFLSQEVDPREQWSWVGVNNNATAKGKIDAGVFQLDSLVNLIEQLVFTNSIHVIGSWISSWAYMNTRLNQLLDISSEQFITPVEFDEKHEESKSYWLTQLLTNKELEGYVRKGIQDYENKIEKSPFKFWSQVVSGTADYLALAEKFDLTYSPHPARSGFLRSGKWHPIISDLQLPEGPSKFKNIIDESRIRLHSKIRETDIINQLIVKIPSIAMLCIAESSENKSPIDIALELRRNSEMKNLRMFLHELTKSANEELLPYDVFEKEKFMKDIIKNVEKEILDIKKIQPDRSPTQINLNYFHCKKIDTKDGVTSINSRNHSGLISKLLLTSSKRTDKIIKEKLRIGHAAIHQYNSWINGDMFKVRDKHVVIKKANIHMGDNIKGNSIKVESGGNISGGTFNQHFDNSEHINIDFNELLKQLVHLLASLKTEASEKEHFDQCSIISESISEVEAGNKSKALSTLKKAGKWTFNIATQVGAGLITEILKGKVT